MGGKPPQYSWEFGRDGSRSATPCLVVFNTLSGAKTHPARLSPAETEAQFGPQWEAGLPVPAGFLQDGRGQALKGAAFRTHLKGNHVILCSRKLLFVLNKPKACILYSTLL